MYQSQRKKARSQNHNLIALNDAQAALYELEIWGSDSKETEFAMTSLRAAIFYITEEIKKYDNNRTSSLS